MKRLAALFFTFILTANLCFAYDISSNERKKLENVYQKIDMALSENPEIGELFLNKVNNIKAKINKDTKQYFFVESVEKYIKNKKKDGVKLPEFTNEREVKIIGYSQFKIICHILNIRKNLFNTAF